MNVDPSTFPLPDSFFSFMQDLPYWRKNKIFSYT